MIGDRIRELRTKKGLTQKALEDRTGISQATICRLENATGEIRALRSTTLKKLAEALDVSVDYLVGKTAEMTPSELIGVNKSALSVIENFQHLGAMEQSIIKAITEDLRARRAERAHSTQSGLDSTLEKANLLWKVTKVERQEPSPQNGFSIRYDCSVQMIKVPAPNYLDLKKRKGEFFASGEAVSLQPIRQAVGTAWHAVQAGFDLDESEILREALSRAKEDALKKISA